MTRDEGTFAGAEPMSRLYRNERGVALILTLLIAFAIAALALGGIMMSSSGALTAKYTAKESALEGLADGGIEIGRDSLNRTTASIPDTGSYQLVPLTTIKDALGNPVPGSLSRQVWFGKTGGRTGGPATSGQYGSNYVSIVSIVQDPRGSVAARRGLFTQDSWSRFAVAVNNWSGGVMYGCGESVTGPFHSNTNMNLQSGCSSPKVTFTGPVEVHGSISNQASGQYQQGVTLGSPIVPFPTAANLATMQSYAQSADAVGGDYDIVGPTLNTWTPGVRIEFVTIDVNHNGVIDWDEGFMRVWVSPNVANAGGQNQRDSTLIYNTARMWFSTPAVGGATNTTDPMLVSRNCGAKIGGRFVTASDTFRTIPGSPNAAAATASRNLLNSAGRRCFLGGDPALFTAVTGDSLTPDSTTVNTVPNTVISAGFQWGKWRKRRTGSWAPITSIRPGDAAYLIPLGANPNFAGVIYVTGDVAISGKLRGRVSVVATGNIVLDDDLTYYVAPGTDCSPTGDILGALATGNMIIENNGLNSEFKVNGAWQGLFDDTPSSVNYNMFFLTLNSWTGEIPGVLGYPGPAGGQPSIAGQSCQGAPSGCVRVTGGLIQGVVGNNYWTYNQIGSGSSAGWAEAHTFDVCGITNPPPYFPTTGRYSKSRYYEIDPVWLNQIGIQQYFHELWAR